MQTTKSSYSIIRKMTDITKLLNRKRLSSFEPSLPKLPVPKLEDTLGKYLQSVKPLVSQSQFRDTEKIVKEFGSPGGIGRKLDDELRLFAGKQKNWVYKFWLEEMYLNNRESLPINSSTGVAYNMDFNFDETERLNPNMVSGTSATPYNTLKKKLQHPISDKMPVDALRGEPLCMNQFRQAFTHYRYPEFTVDKLTPCGDPASSYIIVAYKNQFYKIEVGQANNRINEESCQRQLQWIVRAGSASPESPPVGILTAAPRDTWAYARQLLLQDPENKRNLELIEQSIFVLCLDDTDKNNPVYQYSNLESSKSIQILNGRGITINSANRWFDKPIQYIVGLDGTCGVSYEHSPGEGVFVNKFVDHIFQNGRSESQQDIQSESKSCIYDSGLIMIDANPIKLDWKVSSDVNEIINNTAQYLDKHTSNLELHIVRYSDCDVNYLKSISVSPDAFIQLALQLSNYKLYGNLVCTYESVSLRRFKYGRADNIRSATVEALEWCKSMTSSSTSLSKSEISYLFRRSMNQMVQLKMAAVNGQGFDNHLLALRKLSEASPEMNSTEIFKDSSYHTMNHFLVSTSQVNPSYNVVPCYPPVVRDGFGVCYNPIQNGWQFNISANKGSSIVSASTFSEILVESLQQMKKLDLSK